MSGSLCGEIWKHDGKLDIEAFVTLSCNSHCTTLSDEHNLRQKIEYNSLALSKNGKPNYQ